MSDFWDRSKEERRDREEERSVSIFVYESESVARAAVDCSVHILSDSIDLTIPIDRAELRTYVVYRAQTGFCSAHSASTDASFSVRL